jgi:carboxyl-terminal processing protease
LRPARNGASIAAMPARYAQATLVALALAGGVALLSSFWPGRSTLPVVAASSPPPTPTPAAAAEAGLGCEQARAVVDEVRERLAVPVPALESELFVELLVGWLDPHGLWSAAPDAAASAFAYEHARALRAELEASGEDCPVSARLGAALDVWVGELAPLYDAGRAQAAALSRAAAYELAGASIFEDDPVTVPARELARELGRRTGAFERAFPELAPVLGDTARGRYFPEQSARSWQSAVLDAALRAYVAAADPHGQWVPHAEEAALFVDDPSFDGEPRLWGDMMRTAVGVRIIDAPAPPLEVDDLVLAIDGVLTAGLSVEHVEKLGVLPLDAAAPVRHVEVLRQASARSVRLSVTFDDAEAEVLPLEAARVPYGASSVLHVRIPDVPDDLGQTLAELVAELEPEAAPSGILLDLRGNGGGSTEGACGALGVFLPGAPLFPLLHRGEVVEVLAAGVPGRAGRWRGPVATLVDARTASAAEMIAGALERYDRGAAVGSTTFGKGCVQEYFDDRAGAGVLRLTTLLFTLPDGASVQLQGLEPGLELELEPGGERPERESDLEGAIAPQRGPDVRRARFRGGPRWPELQGRVGPCADAAVCAALRRLGSSPSAVRREAKPSRRRSAEAR